MFVLVIKCLYAYIGSFVFEVTSCGIAMFGIPKVVPLYCEGLIVDVCSVLSYYVHIIAFRPTVVVLL